MSTTKLSSDGSTTVKGYFSQLTDQYTSEVVRGTRESIDRTLGQLVRHLIIEFEQLWRQLGTIGAMSANDELDDYSTTALEMLWTPYIIADLYQRAQIEAGGSGPSPAKGGGGAGGAVDARMLDHGRGGTSSSSTVATAAAGAGAADGAEVTMEQGMKSAQEEALRSLSRQDCLARSHEWFRTYFTWMENIALADEKTIATYSVYRPDARTERLQLARTRSELDQAWRDAEGKVYYLRAKRRRMRELMEESGEALEEAGGEEEEVLRERALARLRWALYDGCHQLQLSARELEMLEAVQPEQRARISADYQRTLDAVRKGELSLGKHTYTILPGGMMVAGTAANPQMLDGANVQRGGGISSEALAAMANQQMFGQHVRDELQVDRNPPTMSLEAFAQKEMAEVQRQMMEAQRMQEEQAEEDARLGPDGVEDRQRKKDAAWDDWKDEHAAYGQTSKGNYS